MKDQFISFNSVFRDWVDFLASVAYCLADHEPANLKRTADRCLEVFDFDGVTP